MKKKKTFVLLELLIAFTLVSLSILPFLRYPYQMMKKEINLLFEMEYERVCEKELVALLDAFFHHKVHYTEVFAVNQKTIKILEKTETIELSDGFKRKVDIIWKATRKKYKIDGQDHYALITLKVHIYPHKKRGKSILKKAKTKVIAQKKQ